MFIWACSALFQHFRDCEMLVCGLGASTPGSREFTVQTPTNSPRSPPEDSLSSMKPLSSACVSVHDRHFQDQRGNGLVESFFIA